MTFFSCDEKPILSLDRDTVSIVKTQRMSGEMEAFTKRWTRAVHEEKS
jgi:hypothetical protein